MCQGQFLKQSITTFSKKNDNESRLMTHVLRTIFKTKQNNIFNKIITNLKMIHVSSTILKIKHNNILNKIKMIHVSRTMCKTKPNNIF
jgi:hypothetical protein